MRALALLIVLALAACNKQPQPDYVDTDGYRQAEAQEFQRRIKSGIPPAVVRAELLAAREEGRRQEHDPELIYEEQQRQKELADLYNVTCQNQPYLEGCR